MARSKNSLVRVGLIIGILIMLSLSLKNYLSAMETLKKADLVAMEEADASNKYLQKQKVHLKNRVTVITVIRA